VRPAASPGCGSERGGDRRGNWSLAELAREALDENVEAPCVVRLGGQSSLLSQRGEPCPPSSWLILVVVAGRLRPYRLSLRPAAPEQGMSLYPADPPTVAEIVAVMRQAGNARHGHRLNGLIVILWQQAGAPPARSSKAPLLLLAPSGGGPAGISGARRGAARGEPVGFQVSR
jgi:hypothetical protein